MHYGRSGCRVVQAAEGLELRDTNGSVLATDRGYAESPRWPRFRDRLDMREAVGDGRRESDPAGGWRRQLPGTLEKGA